MKKTPSLLVLLPALAYTAQAYGGEIHKASTLPFGLDPTHLHLLTNHVPILVTFSGLIVLGFGLLWKNDVTKRAAMLLLLMGAAGGILTLWLGQQAYKPVRGLADEMGQGWLDLHMERAEQVIWLFWVAGIWTAGSLVMVWRKTRFAPAATILAGVLGAATLGVSSWIADAGGKIRHPEVRGDSMPPSDEPGITSEDAPHKH